MFLFYTLRIPSSTDSKEYYFDRAINHLQAKFTINGEQIDLYLGILKDVHSFLKESKEYGYLGNPCEILFLSYQFVETLLEKGNEAAFPLIGEKDPLFYGVIFMPYFFQGWKLIVVDNRKSYRRITYFDPLVPTILPDFVSKISAYFCFDFVQRHPETKKSNRSISYFLSSSKKPYFGFSFSDIYICQIVRSIVLNQHPIRLLELPLDTLRVRMLADMRIMKRKNAEFLVVNRIKDGY